MKSILILPGAVPAVEALSEIEPLGNLRIFGASLAERWLEYLASMGTKQVRVVACDRPEAIEAALGDGSRWGIRVEVTATAAVLAGEQAKSPFDAEAEVAVADSLPGLPQWKLFDSYAGFFKALQQALTLVAARGRIGLKQIRPGIWAGMHVHISDGAVLEGPCWLGNGVHIEKDAHVGPNAVLEDFSWVGAGAEVRDSLIAPETHLGVATNLHHSLALGNTLVDWECASVVKIADAFLLCSLRAAPLRERMAAMARRAAQFIHTERHVLTAKALALRPTILQ